jgi:hypothetical protein
MLKEKLLMRKQIRKRDIRSMPIRLSSRKVKRSKKPTPQRFNIETTS